MQFDLTTFILEIINFLVLLWILQRLLYRPVLNLLDARVQRIKAETEQARQLHNEAESFRNEYQTKLTDSERQLADSRRQVDEELAETRRKAFQQLNSTLADEEAKLRARTEALTQSRTAELVKEAATIAYGQAATMLQRLASVQLTESIVQMVIDDLAQLESDESEVLAKAAANLPTGSQIEVVCAHALSGDCQKMLTQALSTASGQILAIVCKEDSALIAGIRIILGECQLDANLADELAFFRHETRHD